MGKCWQKIGVLYVLFFTAVLTTNKVWAQEYNFKQLTQNEGLSARSIYKIIQDRSGFIWLATDNGVFRYDGLNFKKYGACQGFTQKGAYFIYLDSKNCIWAISFNFKLFKLEQDVFVEQKMFNMHCWLEEDSHGNLWIATRSSKLYKTTHGKVVDSLNLNHLNGPIFMFKVLKNGGIVVSSRLQCVYINQKKITKISIAEIGNHVVRIFEKKDGGILLSNFEGIYSFDIPTNSCSLLYPMQGIECYCFFEDSTTGDMWVGHSKGTMKFEKGNINSHNGVTFLPQKSVLSFLSLPNKSNWFGTLDYGLFSEHFQSFHITEANRLLNSNIKFLQRDGDSIYLFSNNGDIQILYQKVIIPYKQPIPRKEIEFFYNVVQNENGEIYFTCKYSGMIFRIKKGKFEVIPIEYPKCLFPSNNGQVSNLFLQSGIVKLSKNSMNNNIHKDFFKEVWLKHAENDPFFKPILQQSDSDYFFLAGNGWIKITMGKNEIRSKNFRPQSQVSSLALTKQGTIIESVLGQGIVFNKPDTQYVIGTEDGLLSKEIQQLYYSEPYLFASSIDGLAVMFLDKNDYVSRINNLSRENYLKSNLVNDVLVHKNDVFIATVEGVTILPKSTLDYQETSKVFIDHVFLNSIDTSIQSSYELPNSINNVEIQFGCISYDGMRNVLYKYKLIGSDSNYTYSFANSVRYNALIPGVYEFWMYGKTLNGKWSTTPIKTKFIILAPFYKRKWFLITVISVFSLLVYLSFKAYIRSVKKRESLKGRLVQTELKALRLHMNPHFIFNTLNSLQSFVLQNKPLQANMYISKFSSLIRHILDDRRAVEVVLSEELKFLRTYIEIEQMRLKNIFSLEIKIDPKMNPETIIIPSMIIQPFIENAIKYGLAPSENLGSKLSLRFEFKEGDFIKVNVTDNGVGRNYYLEKPSSQISTGIEFTNERLKLILNSKVVFDPVKVLDLFDEDGKAIGTDVEIIIPILR